MKTLTRTLSADVEINGHPCPVPVFMHRPYRNDDDYWPEPSLLGTGSVHQVSDYGTNRRRRPIGFVQPIPKTGPGRVVRLRQRQKRRR